MTLRIKQYVVRFVLVAFVLALCGGGWLLYSTLKMVDHAECALHAVNLVTILADKYVEKNHKWPASWDDLATVSTPGKWSMFTLPDDWPKIPQYVEVDFQADPALLAKQSVEEFDAIKPTGPNYPYKEYGHVAALLETLRKVAGSQHEQVR